MKRIKSLSLLLFFAVSLLTCETDSNVPADFQKFYIKYYGGTGNQQGVDIVVNNDGTMILLGNSEDEQNGKHFFVVKTDSAGAILWQVSYDTTDINTEIAVDIEPTIDGNYVIAAQKTLSPVDVDVELIKITQEGVIVIKDSIYGFVDKMDSVQSVTPLSDGNYLITGSTNQTKPEVLISEIEGFVFKCGSDFLQERILWKQTYGSGEINRGIKVFETGPGAFYLFMSSNEKKLGEVDYNFLTVPIDAFASEGGPLAFPDDESDVENEKLVSATHIPSTNGFALVGTSEFNGSKSVYSLIIGNPPNKSNIVNNGNQKLDFQDNYSGRSIYPSKFGGFLVLADQEVTIGNVVTKTIILIRLDAQGRSVWSRRFGGEYSDSGMAVAELSDGKIVIVGTARLDNQEKMVLIKVNSDGRFLN